MDKALTERYGNMVRARVCGLCWRGDRLLMVNHRGLTAGDFWSPPGGGIEFGESAEQCLTREFLEETGLLVTTRRFMFACEFVQHPLHAIELFFEVQAEKGEPVTGDDPELGIITDVRFMSAAEIAAIAGSSRHGIFQLIPSADDLRSLTGFFRI